jgi:hypothetical protein
VFARIVRAPPQPDTRLMSQFLSIRDCWTCQIDHGLIALGLRNKSRWIQCGVWTLHCALATIVKRASMLLALSSAIKPILQGIHREPYLPLQTFHTPNQATHNEVHRQLPRCRPDPWPHHRDPLTRLLKHQKRLPKISLL